MCWAWGYQPGVFVVLFDLQLAGQSFFYGYSKAGLLQGPFGFLAFIGTTNNSRFSFSSLFFTLSSPQVYLR